MVVESEINLQTTQIQNGNNFDFHQEFKSAINTYSTTTLNNASRIVVNMEPEALVFRYIKKADVNKIFEDRANRIKQFISDASNAEKKYAVADALKYYYWAYFFLSHPEANALHDDDNHLLNTWLLTQINEILSDVKIKMNKVEKTPDQENVYFTVTYKGMPASDFEYSYFTGKDQTPVTSIRDGIGVAEFYGAEALDLKALKLKVDYASSAEANSDKELSQVMAVVKPPFIKNARKDIPLNADTLQTEKENNLQATQAMQRTQLASVQEYNNPGKFKAILDKVVNAIKIKNFESIKLLFTPEGFDNFTRLINYGNATILPFEEIKFYTFENSIIARSVPMKFNFRANNQSFTEDVVFTFNKDGLIEIIDFALDASAARDIAAATHWPENERMTIITFMEHFKTAYALKRLDYIKSVFADDAYIIVGKMLEKAPVEPGQPKLPKVQYSRLTKDQYIKNLDMAFKSKDYINIKFEDTKLQKALKGGKPVYGLNLAQRYFSSNYGDFGYLFLLIDYSDTARPQIKVRVWSPARNADNSVPDLSSVAVDLNN